MDVLFRYVILPSFLLFALYGLFVSLRESWRDFWGEETDEGDLPRVSRFPVRTGYRW